MLVAYDIVLIDKGIVHISINWNYSAACSVYRFNFVGVKKEHMYWEFGTNQRRLRMGEHARTVHLKFV